MLHRKEAGMSDNAEIILRVGRAFIRYPQKAMAVALFLFLLFSGLLPLDASAAGPATGQSSGEWSQPGGREDNFLFSAPRGFLGFRIGRFFPRAEGPLFDELTDTYTLEKNDFRAWNFGFDGGVNLHERFDVVISVDYMTRTKKSEYRDWVDEQDLPIVQDTNFTQVPITAGLKFRLIPRGRQIGQYAWVPNRVVPYLSAGAGIQWSRFKQSGDFIDFGYEDLPIYTDEVKSTGWSPVGYLGGGMDINIHKHTYVILDLRYSWAKPELDMYVVGYDPVDLSGFRAAAGLQWYF